VFKLMHGYGRWLQLSVFQCRLSAQRRVELARRLEAAIHAREDHVLILDLGPADRVDPRVESLGKSFEPVMRAAVVI
jgi:CRISPR-associated protein Cas2